MVRNYGVVWAATDRRAQRERRENACSIYLGGNESRCFSNGQIVGPRPFAP